ncbi:hypothetical protein [Neobacillus sp. D3-1R]
MKFLFSMMAIVLLLSGCSELPHYKKCACGDTVEPQSPENA